ncbi:fatty acid desaturase family protein [Trinickia sp.]|uniref:fatty acid desaturase family protein n=1 Tax=Trinickia sp. TaxID=2571163 RepID=UPI003F7F6BA9
MHARIRPSARRRHSDWPSALFLAAVLTNTVAVAIAATSNTWLVCPLVLLQAWLILGCQEAKHLSVHGTFIGNRHLNDTIGIAFAALFGVNFVAYRYFHLAHHHATCTEADPEGKLYALSWRTRWIWLLAPLELPWVAWHIGRTGCPMVPPSKRRLRNAAFVWMAAFAALVGIGLYYAPRTIAFAYLIPLALFAWFDFMLTQAEHYDTSIAPASNRREPGSITYDIVLPLCLGWMTLHRTLHRVHHREPGSPWFQAPRRLNEDPTARPIGYMTFVRRWLAGGPRLWLTEHGTLAGTTAAQPSRPRGRA